MQAQRHGLEKRKRGLLDSIPVAPDANIRADLMFDLSNVNKFLVEVTERLARLAQAQVQYERRLSDNRRVIDWAAMIARGEVLTLDEQRPLMQTLVVRVQGGPQMNQLNGSDRPVRSFTTAIGDYQIRKETHSMSMPEINLPTTVTPSGLEFIDVVVGSGTEARSGNNVSVHYTGWLTNGVKFDSSVDRGQPFPFKLGAGNVIRGWDQGVAGMKVGGKRRLIIPADLGYGSRGAGGVIPPNAKLIFDVELLAVN